MPLINGTNKAESINGSTGDDTIVGKGGNDTINGVDGNDLIDGGLGADRVNGGEGSDTIIAGRADTIHGDGGDDLITFAGQEPTGLSTSISGDAGVDTLVLDFSTAFDSLTSSNFGGGSGSIAGISYSGIEQLSMTGGSASDKLLGGDGNDTLAGNGGNDRLDGRAGINVLVGGTGRDVGLIDLTSTSARLIVTWTGADTVIGGSSFTDIEGLGLKAGAGNDVIDVQASLASSEIYGGEGADRLYSDNDWADTIYGGGGNDTIVFGRRDVVHGGLGDDTFRFSEQDPNGVSTQLYGDEGINTLILNFSTAFDAVESSHFGASGIIESINYSGFDRLIFTGGSASDSLVGGAGFDTLTGNGGNDILDGGAGPNRLVGGSGRDLGRIDLSGDVGSGVVVNFVAGNSIVAGSRFIQVEALGLEAGGGDDYVNVTRAQGGSDLAGNGGADTLTGSTRWNDILDGGDGNDVITFNFGDSVRGGNGDDSLNITQRPVTGFSTSANGDAGLDTLTVDFSSAVLGFTSSNGNTGSGSIGGVSYQNIELMDVTGGSGADSIAGGQGSDTLIGGEGADTISGLSDTDYITGGHGADKLTGGLGVVGDVFIYEALSDSTIEPSERDTITDFTDVDRIDLSAIDAVSGTVADDAIDFIGSAQFSGAAGELRYQSGGGLTTILGDVDGDGAADFAIDLTGDITLVSGEFVP
jgi:Ca2+-binding RTX toxin-like protein